MKITPRRVYVSWGWFLVLMALIFPRQIQEHRVAFTLVFVLLPIVVWLVWTRTKGKT